MFHLAFRGILGPRLSRSHFAIRDPSSRPNSKTWARTDRLALRVLVALEEQVVLLVLVVLVLVAPAELIVLVVLVILLALQVLVLLPTLRATTHYYYFY
jgi:hypothetical protein